jgi:hypothetical protein
MKKVLIHENTKEINGDIDHVQQVCFPAIQKVIKRFEKFNLGEMNTELLKDCLFNNSTEISKLFTQQAETDTAAVKNPILKQNLFNGISQAVIEFRLSVNDLTGICNRVLLKLITIEANEPVLTDDNLEKLKELHRTYVSPEEAKFFELHKKIANDLNSLFVNVDYGSVSPIFMSRFFVVVDGKFEATEATNYGIFMKH